MKNSQLANNIARIIAAAYIGALIAGPAPFGWASITLERNSEAVGVASVAVVFIIPWLIAGFIAGRRLTLLAAPIGYLFWQHHLLLQVDGLLMVLCVIPILSGLLGVWLSGRWGIVRSLHEWRHWWAVGLAALLLATYTSTLGPSVACQAMTAKFKPAEPDKIIAHTEGAYIAFEGLEGYHYLYYTDPTGLVYLYKLYLG